jgi:hypothetical protein
VDLGDDAAFFVRLNTKQGLTVLVAAQRQNRDQELAVALGPKQPFSGVRWQHDRLQEAAISARNQLRPTGSAADAGARNSGLSLLPPQETSEVNG